MYLPIHVLRDKQNLLFIITGLAVILIICVSVFSFVTANRMLTNITRQNMGTILENSDRGRQLVNVYADINVMSHTFHGRNDYLESEGARLQDLFRDTLIRTDDTGVKAAISEVLTNLVSFVTQGKEINAILLTRNNLHNAIHNRLENIEIQIGDAFIDQALEGKDTSYIEQLLMLVVGYKESLLVIGKKFAELHSWHPLMHIESEKYLVTEIDDLTLRLQTITASAPDIAEKAEQIVQAIFHYKRIIIRYYQELEVLGAHMSALKNSTDKLLSSMSVFDEDISESMQAIESKIVSTTLMSSAVVSILAILVVVSMCIIIARLFRSMDLEIHERKQAEKALKESEKRFRTLFEDVPTPVHGYGLDGSIHYWNKACEKTYGYKKEEAIGKKSIELIIPPALRNDVEEKRRTAANTGSMPEAEELLLMRHDGSRVPVISSFAVVQLDEKKPEFYCLDVDMTIQKKLQAQLQQSLKMESIGTLTGGIAHDFNNFLSIIIGNTELGIDQIPEWNPVHVNLKEIKSASLRAAGIVKQLLNFSRKDDLHLRPIEAIAVVRDALDLLRSTIPTTIEISKYLPDATATILADPIQINQVLMNLCVNASQAMEETGGVLSIAVDFESLTEDSGDPYPDLSVGDYIKITVRDTGPGIDSSIIDRIFDPYFTTKTIGKGSGMGLAVVHGIVQSHGGAITVTSQPESGTTFTLHFPVIAEQPAGEVILPDEIPFGDETILFVDDEEAIVLMAQKVLQQLGYTVEARLNPTEAVILFQSKPSEFDLVITDMTMPQMTGVELFEVLTAIRDSIPVIICTGHSSLIDEQRAQNLGVNAFIMKPIAINQFAHTIRNVLDGNKNEVTG